MSEGIKSPNKKKTLNIPNNFCFKKIICGHLKNPPQNIIKVLEYNNLVETDYWINLSAL